MPRPVLHVLVIAHPDDESMFFLPMIRALKAAQETVWLLCLTTGNYDGLGKIRTRELEEASRLVGFDKLLLKDTLKDHPTRRWDIDSVKDEIVRTLQHAIFPGSSWGRIKLYTFDKLGVSGHINHTDTFLGVRSIVEDRVFPLSDGSSILIDGWSLVSESNLIAKFVPIFSWLLLILSYFMAIPDCPRNDASNQSYRLLEPTLNWKAMATHHSQFVWYRRLFIVFSCYTYFNHLEKIRTNSQFSKDD